MTATGLSGFASAGAASDGTTIRPSEVVALVSLMSNERFHRLMGPSKVSVVILGRRALIGKY